MKNSNVKNFVITMAGTSVSMLILGAAYKVVKYLEWRKQTKKEEEERTERWNRWLEAKG